MSQNFFDLVKAALPPGVRPQDLIALVPRKWWDERPYLASAYALRKCRHIDWNAYLESYPDVKGSGMDACLHFLQHGIYEGRKLAGSNWMASAPPETCPLLSIVIINYNNAHLLPKTLASATGQTLRDIEIIVVDDGSTDKSRDVVSAFASRDPRIRLIVNRDNSATLITRKRGVEAACGRYLMLLDSDDYLAPNACEIAVGEIAKGYDMVKFGAHIINSLGAPEEEIRDCDDWCNRGEPREYFNDEIVSVIFREGKMSWHVWSCIYPRGLCQAAFADLPDEYITGPDDLYALLAIARRATSMLKIADRLYFYNYGPGVSVTVDKEKLIKYAPARAGAILAIDRFARKYSLNIDPEHLHQNLCADLLAKFLAISGKHDVSGVFNKLAQRLGFEACLQALFRRFGKEPEKLANLIRPLAPGPEIRHIGIFAPKLHYGGMESVILTLCGILKKNNYELTIFLNERSERDNVYTESARIIYLGAFGADNGTFSKRFLNLVDAVRATTVNVMLYFQPQASSLLWDLMTLHYFNIPVILWQAGNFAMSMCGDNARGHNLAERIFRNADAVICQSDMEELYLKTRGINAASLHAPVAQKAYAQRNEVPPRIALVGRLGALVKQTGESLKVLRKVVNRAPWVSMRMIGDFYNLEQTHKFRQKIREYGLEKHVSITGWTENAGRFLEDCGVLLSVSACESMALAISEAQAYGLPCVIYDIPIEQTRDNPSIISVSQGDYESAADELLSLLNDFEKWSRLSLVAIEQSRKYAPDAFADRLSSFLNSFQRRSPVKKYSAPDYASVINYASFYSGLRLECSW